MALKVEMEYEVIFMIDMCSYGPKMVMFRGCGKFHQVAFFKIQDGRHYNQNPDTRVPYVSLTPNHMFH